MIAAMLDVTLIWLELALVLLTLEAVPILCAGCMSTAQQVLAEHQP